MKENISAGEGELDNTLLNQLRFHSTEYEMHRDPHSVTVRCTDSTRVNIRWIRLVVQCHHRIPSL